MHPAYSVILFTCASGAGYGLLIWLAALGALGLVPITSGFAVAGLGLALALITVGLLSSTLHLGHPERAWRAFSQWRSSWLSREGVAAVFTYLPALALAFAWIVVGQTWGWAALAAWLTVAGALATVLATGMIYASLPTIRAWAQPLTAPVYLVLALASGAVLLCLLLAAAGYLQTWQIWLAAILLAVGWALKAIYWSVIDTEPRDLTVGAATGLARYGDIIRQVEAPHTQANYVMREMGYQVARKHAATLRQVAVVLAFLIPMLALFLAMLLGGAWAIVLTLLGALVMAAGLMAERWLFFAEAEHVSMLYYGRKAA